MMKMKSLLLAATLTLAFAASAQIPAPVIDLKCNAGDFAALQDVSANKCQVVLKNQDLMEWSDGPAGKTIAFKNENIEAKQKRAELALRLPQGFDSTKGFTLLFNFKTPADYQYKKRYQLLHYAQGVDTVTGFSLFVYWRSITLRYGTTSKKGISTKATEIPIRPDTWYDVAVTYDGKRAAIYVNGKLAAEAIDAVIPVPKMRNPTLFVGGTGATGAGYGFSGIISKVQLYDRALTADEVADIE